MNSLRLKSGLFAGVLAVFLVASGSAAHGQVSVLKQIAGKQEGEKSKTTEKSEDVRARLEKWHDQAQATLEQLDDSVPAGVTTAEADARRRDLEQTVLVATRSLKNLTETENAHKTLEASRAADAAWKGFTEKPPYSMLMVDELLNERDAVREKLTSYESSLLNYRGLLSSALAETKTAEDAAGGMIATVQNADASMVAAAKWRLEAARAKSRLTAIRAGLLQSGCEGFTDLITAAKIDLTLLDRQVKAARANCHLGDEDLAKLEKISADRKKALQKEIEAVSKKLKSSRADRAQAQTALTAIPSPNNDPDALTLAKFRVRVAEDRENALQSITEGLESLVQLENLNWTVHQERRGLINAANAGERTKALDSIRNYAERFVAWENVLQNEISTSGAELSKIESRAGSITSTDPRFALVNEQRAAGSEKLAMQRRLVQAVTSERKLIQRWVAEYSPEPDEGGWFGHLARFASRAWDITKKAWSFEVMSFEDKVEVDGQIIAGRIPVTLGMLLRAVLFFAIGYWVASRIARHIQKKLVRKGYMMDAQARTMRNWAMIVVGVFLVLGTLAFLGIPPTVFAFFGGALAIGLGFGLQTLIKNFISGIIVLVERKVRVGDMLDVDGIVGTVVEVNTRSSIIRGPDDVETMIPNSTFLENRVTNWTLSNPRMRRCVRVGVAYGTAPQTVMESLTEAAGRHGLVCKDPAPFAVFEDFGDSALMFALYFWVKLDGSASPIVIASDLRLMIEKRFTELGIGIPFPQRDLHLATDKPIQVRIAPEEK